jgi:acetyl-CoA carboxylase biotin carboxyl carrier protein
MTDDHPLDERSQEARRADHDAIDRLADDLLPALAERLAATGLGELEVREGAWRLRLRRRVDAQPHADHGRGAHRGEAGRSGRGAGHVVHEGHATDDLPRLTSIGPAVPDPLAEALDHAPLVSRSPGVGVLHLDEAHRRVGARVRAGDVLGRVDVLGVGQEVVAPGDGVLETAFSEDGDVVEYGQPLLAFRPARDGADGAAAAGTPTAEHTGSPAAPVAVGPGEPDTSRTGGGPTAPVGA